MNIIYRSFSPKDNSKLKLLDKEASSGQLTNYSKMKRNPYNSIKEYFIDKGGRFWVAEDTDNHKIIGAIGLKLISKGIGKMKSLRVHPNYRRKGIAKKLVSILEEYCKENNFTKITLGVGADNDSVPAVKLYESQGYTLTDKKEFEDKSKAFYYEKKL